MNGGKLPPRWMARPFSRGELLIAAIALGALAILVYPAYTLSGAKLFLKPWIDGASSEFGFYPWDRFVADRLAAGEIPLWNPHEAGGCPLVGNYQSSLFYPLKIILYLFTAIDSYLLIKQALAALLMYRFCRFACASRAASAIGGVAFGFSTYFLNYVNQVHTNGEILIPLVLYAVSAYLRFGGAWRFTVGAVSVALVIFGGHPESTFYALLFTSMFTVAEGIVRAGRRPDDAAAVVAPPSIQRRWVGGPMMFVAGIGLGAVQLLPFVEYLPHAWHIHAPGVGSIHRDAIGFVELVAARLRSADFPMGVGAVAFALALYAILWIRQWRTRSTFFAAVAVVFLGLFLGLWPFTLLSKLPLIGEAGNIKYPGPMVCAALAALAAFGFDRLRARAADGAGGAFIGVALLTGLLGIGVPILLRSLGGHDDLAIDRAVLAFAPVAMVAGALQLHRLGRIAAPAFAWWTVVAAVLAVVVNEITNDVVPARDVSAALSYGLASVIIASIALPLGFVMVRGGRLGGRASVVLAALPLAAILAVHVATDRVVQSAQHKLVRSDEVPEFVAAIRRDRAARDDGPFRTVGEPLALPANHPTVYGLDDLRGMDALYVTRFHEFLNVVNGHDDYRRAFMTELRRRAADADHKIDQMAALKMLYAEPIGMRTDWHAFEFVFGKRSGVRPERFENPLLDLAGVAYLLYSPFYRGPIVSGANYETIYDAHGYRVVANRAAGPRAFLTHRVEVAADRDALAGRLADPAFDWRGRALVEAPIASVPAVDAASTEAGPQRPDERVRVVSRGTHEVVLDVVAREPALLVLTENYYPGWVAEDGNGAPLEIVPVDLAFRGVVLPAGEHRVRFRYRPWSVWGGALVGLAVAAILAGWVVSSRRRRPA